jgi:hypothetical protein
MQPRAKENPHDISQPNFQSSIRRDPASFRRRLQRQRRWQRRKTTFFLNGRNFGRLRMMTVRRCGNPPPIYTITGWLQPRYLDFSRYDGEGLIWSDEIDGNDRIGLCENGRAGDHPPLRRRGTKAEALGCGFSEDTRTRWTGQGPTLSPPSAVRKRFRSNLRNIGLREESFLLLISVSLLCDQLMNHLYGENGSAARRRIRTTPSAGSRAFTGLIHTPSLCG